MSHLHLIQILLLESTTAIGSQWSGPSARECPRSAAHIRNLVMRWHRHQLTLGRCMLASKRHQALRGFTIEKRDTSMRVGQF